MFRRPADWMSVAGPLAGCLVVLAARPCAGADGVQPDRLNFGVVHVGARVQGSVRVFVDARDARSRKAEVSPPPFVRVDQVAVGTQDYGPGNTKGYCDIAVSVDSARAGAFSAPMVMTLGDRRVEVPVAAEVRPRDESRPRVLVADTPFQKYSTSDAKLFDPWLALVERRGLDVDYLEVRGGKPVFEGVDLAAFDGVLLGEMGIIGLKDSDLAAIRKYAEGGGRVILTANAFYRGTVAMANRVFVPYGLEMKDEESSKVDQFAVGPDRIAPGPIAEGVKVLSFHRPSPAVVLDKDRTMVLVASPADPDEHFVAMALAGEGQVVSLGVSLWWSWVGKADNAVLLGNLLPRRPRAK